MKKLIAMLLCFAMVAALGATSAFAVGLPITGTGVDQAKAAEAVEDARTQKGNATDAANELKAIEQAKKAVEKFEKIKFDPSKKAEDVTKAQEELTKALANIYANTKVDVTGYTDSQKIAEAKKAATKKEADAKLAVAKDALETAYWLTTGTKMDQNAWIIGVAKLQAASDLATAQAAAAAAKTSAAKAQATAKALIADTIKTAQDAAATAVANAQKDAYTTLANNYADAVEAFWEEVAAAWDLG